MNKYYVYEYYIKETGEVFYVGKGKGNRYQNIKNRNKFFIDMYNTHNCSTRKVCENLSEDEAFSKEEELIRYYRENTNFRLTNQTDGGEGTSGYRMSKKDKFKISEASKDKWKDKKFREMQIAHRMYGVYQSKEFKEKISKVTTGENNGNYKNYWTDEQKSHLSNLRINKGIAKGINNPRCVWRLVEYMII